MSKLGIRRALYYIIGFGLLLIAYPIILGITSLTGILVFDIEFLAVFFVFFVVAYIIARALENRPGFGKAEIAELRREDDILLQATALSQSALWIYLNLLPNDEYTTSLKWLIPSAAILFYVVRAIGKMKDNNKWRYWSMFILTFIIGYSSYSIIQTGLKSRLTGILLIDNVDVTYPLLGATLSLVPLLMLLIFQKPLRKRYEIADSGEIKPDVS